MTGILRASAYFAQSAAGTLVAEGNPQTAQTLMMGKKPTEQTLPKTVHPAFSSEGGGYALVYRP